MPNDLIQFGAQTLAVSADVNSNLNELEARIYNLPVKQACRTVSTANITLSGLQTVDGVAQAAGDSHLAAGQTIAANNGPYVVGTGAWSRRYDADTGVTGGGGAKIGSGVLIPITEGTVNAGKLFQLTTANPIVWGSTATAWAAFSGGGAGAADGGGYASISVAGGTDYTLTATQWILENLEFTGVLTGNINIIVPTTPHGWLVKNSTTGAYTLTVKTASGTGAIVPQGTATNVQADGVNVVSMLGGGLTGGQKLTGGTAAAENLSLSSTANAAKGKVLIGTSAYDEANNRLGLGTASPASTLDVAGSVAFPVRSVSTSGAFSATDYLVLVDCTAAPVTLTLPTSIGVSGRCYYAKKVDASANALTIATTASQTIEGPTSRATATQYDGMEVQSDGANWRLIVWPQFTGSGPNHTAGLVPDAGSSAGTTRFLREDGVWIAPAGTGTVTSVALTLPAELTVTGSPITTTGTLAAVWASQAANKFLASPSGGAGAMSARVIAPADLPVMGASGVSTHAPGVVPDTPATAGSNKVLCENATWIALAESNVTGLVADLAVKLSANRRVIIAGGGAQLANDGCVFFANTTGSQFDFTLLTGSGTSLGVYLKVQSGSTQPVRILPLVAATLTGTTTSGSAVVTMASTTGISPGHSVSGTGIPTNAHVSSVITNTSVTMDANATANGTVSLTFSETIDGGGQLVIGVNGFATLVRDGVNWQSVSSGNTVVGTTTPSGVQSVGATAPIASTGGTSPTISIADSGVTAATYGDATHAPQIVIDAKGRITSATNVVISGSGGGGGSSAAGSLFLFGNFH